jgi:hypothetical protein
MAVAAVAAAVLMAQGAAARASIVQFKLDNLTAPGLGSATTTGTFDYDTSAGEAACFPGSETSACLSNIDITIQGGAVFTVTGRSLITFDAGTTATTGATDEFSFDDAVGDNLILDVDAPFLVDGDNGVVEGIITLLEARGFPITSPFRSGGSIDPALAPEPGSLGLIISGLIGFGCLFIATRRTHAVSLS